MSTGAVLQALILLLQLVEPEGTLDYQREDLWLEGFFAEIVCAQGDAFERIGAVVLVVLIIAGFVLMISTGVTGVVRDIVIILLALESLLLIGLTVFLVIQVTLLVRMVRDEVRPLIKSAQETVNSARGTTQFVGKHIVTPTANAAGNVARVSRMFQVLFRGK